MNKSTSHNDISTFFKLLRPIYRQITEVIKLDCAPFIISFQIDVIRIDRGNTSSSSKVEKKVLYMIYGIRNKYLNYMNRS